MGGQFLALWPCSPSSAWGRLCSSHPWPLWQMKRSHGGNPGWGNRRRSWIPAGIVLASRWSRAGTGRASCRSRRSSCLQPYLLLSQEKLLLPWRGLTFLAGGLSPFLRWLEDPSQSSLEMRVNLSQGCLLELVPAQSWTRRGGLMSVKSTYLCSPSISPKLVHCHCSGELGYFPLFFLFLLSLSQDQHERWVCSCQVSKLNLPS